MGEALTTIANAFIELFRKGSMFSRLITLIIVIMILSGIDLYSGFGFNLRMNHQVNLLSRINDLTQKPLEQENDLIAIRKSLVKKLDEYANRNRISLLSPWFSQQRLWKFLWAFAPWLLAAVVIFFSSLQGDRNFSVAVFVVVMGFVLAVCGALIPTFRSPWFNYIGNLVVFGILPISSITAYGQRVNAKK